MIFVLDNKAQTIVGNLFINEELGPVNVTLQYYELDLKVSNHGIEFKKENELQNQ